MLIFVNYFLNVNVFHDTAFYHTVALESLKIALQDKIEVSRLGLIGAPDTGLTVFDIHV
jgi:hypothetical protein